MSRYAFLFMDDGIDPQEKPTAQQQAVYGEIFKWFERNGPKVALGGAELQPTRTATTIRKRGDKVTVVDGPYLETKEGIGGYTVFELPDDEAAIELAKSWPGSGVEIRPIVTQDQRVGV